MLDKWVQHKSGCGGKFQVQHEYPTTWECTQDLLPSRFLSLPKEDYLEVIAPEHWKDVTDCCTTMEDGGKYGDPGHFLMHGGEKIAKLICGGRYRWKNGRIEKKCGR